jgi:hypothetical protein
MANPHQAWGLRTTLVAGLCLWAGMHMAVASSVVWSCSRSEPEPEAFEAVRAFRIDNLSVKDDYAIAITLADLYGAYSGETIRMGAHELSVCSLPVQDPLQLEALDMLGFDAQDLTEAKQRSSAKLVTVPSIHQMQKCIVENHPAIGFFTDVVENERVGPCF